MSLVEHAKSELERAGLFDKDSDYNGMLGPAIMKMVETFAAEGHSGASAAWTLQLFNRVASYKALTRLTSDSEEWCNVSEYGGPNDAPIWQNKRDSSYFSHDGGKTGYSIDDKKREIKTFRPSSSGREGEI